MLHQNHDMMPCAASASHDRLDPPSFLREEWPAVNGACHSHILLVGDAASTSAALRAFQPIHRSPCVIWECGNSPLVLPPSETVGTLVLHDVAALSLNEQQLLSDWLARETGNTNVISTSAVPLFPLITRGGFLATLYYRLNVLYVDLSLL